ncbi:GNAT family N-acetyltransferase [Thermaerobacillus caldiproteolyticus]|uniref:GNAT family N-acetyltransferase n=1 Tax=Thermaerobacillus caldiproteolyticus TaxID=247480 RepID=UPI00188B6D60|nr:GNAT family N-acetyltransferase [Anoxybacillus caldiproteolyticus]QPA30699.1 GNAT family N-acetyltransferase [Anoxybacillus caldiproteolyticus]
MLELIRQLKTSIRKGQFLTLLPYDNQYAANIVKLRNTDRARYYLNQSFELSIDMQNDWAKEYFKRDNDIYWVIQCNETKQIIGSTSLYNITSLQCEKGRLIIDEKFATRKPYVLEAEIMIIKIAFKELGLNKIITSTRYDNGKMESINRRLGFVKSGSHYIRGVLYNDFVLEKENFDSKPFERILVHWVKRGVAKSFFDTSFNSGNR